MADFGFWVAVAVVGGLVLTGILGMLKWLRAEDNRRLVRQLMCRHDWHPIDKGWGTNVVYVTPYDENCRKCGKER
jgi:hypothetical protein